MKTLGAYQAKTHLPRLLGQVARGEEIIITKHGHPVARMTSVAGQGREPVAQAIAGLKEFQGRHALRGLKIRQMIDEGRRF